MDDDHDDDDAHPGEPPRCYGCRKPMVLFKQTARVVIFWCEPCGTYHAADLMESARK